VLIEGAAEVGKPGIVDGFQEQVDGVEFGVQGFCGSST
jgi:hypothetical protein